MDSTLRRICERYGLSLVYLFGSRARTGVQILAGEKVVEDDPLSDIDVGVVTDGPLPEPSERPSFYARLYNELEELFKPLRLDLVFLEEQHSVFQAEAIKGICVYQSSEQKRDEYEMRVLRRAADFAPFLRRFLQDVLDEVSPC